MRLVTWNCNGALRRKRTLLDTLNADVLVVQECEDPGQSSADYRAWAGEHAWIGYGRNKGIGIFSRRGLSVERLDWPSGGFELFLPVRIGDAFEVVGVWTQDSTPSNLAYIGQFWHYFQEHGERFGTRTLIVGDLNSNAIWDKPRRLWNHSECVHQLARRGFHSLYHLASGEMQGSETKPTFYLYRSAERPYHIDYVFAHQAVLGASAPRVQVGGSAEWITASDHMPLIVDLPDLY